MHLQLAAFNKNLHSYSSTCSMNGFYMEAKTIPELIPWSWTAISLLTMIAEMMSPSSTIYLTINMTERATP